MLPSPGPGARRTAHLDEGGSFDPVTISDNVLSCLPMQFHCCRLAYSAASFPIHHTILTSFQIRDGTTWEGSSSITHLRNRLKILCLKRKQCTPPDSLPRFKSSDRSRVDATWPEYCFGGVTHLEAECAHDQLYNTPGDPWRSGRRRK